MPTSGWPAEGTPLAWGLPDNLPASSVPVTQSDLKAGLTKAAYLDRLCARLAWLIEREDSPRRAMAALADAMEAAGAWSGPRTFPSPEDAVQEMLLDNPAFGDLLNLVVQLPDERPFPVRRMPAAEAAIRDTSQEEWISLAFQGASDGPMM